MRPVLVTLHVGSSEVALHTYGLLIALGLAAGITLAAREARRRRMDVGRVLDFAFWGVVAGFIGSRLAYGLVNADDFARACVGRGAPRSVGAVLSDCTRLLHIWEGGLVFYGGVVGTALVAFYFARAAGWSFWTITDVFAPGVALGHALGRFGCYAAGCCFGKTTTGGWGASFPSGSVAFDELSSLSLVSPGASFTPPLHPTQLYEAFGELLIFAGLMLARGRLRGRPGALVITYAAAYAVLRFVVELFRGDVARRFVVELSTPGLARVLGVPASEPVLLSVGQVGSLLLLGACAFAYARRRRAWTAAAPTTR